MTAARHQSGLTLGIAGRLHLRRQMLELTWFEVRVPAIDAHVARAAIGRHLGGRPIVIGTTSIRSRWQKHPFQTTGKASLMVLEKSMVEMISPRDAVRAVEEQLRLHVGAADWWTLHRGASPVLATAIHNGHAVRADLEVYMAISAEERLREEDPFTEFVTRDVSNRIAFHRSRFEIDLNRPRDGAVYLSPEQAWGLDIWRRSPPASEIEHSLAVHDEYYAMLGQVLKGLQERHGRFVVLDIHSYNHRRDGPGSAVADPSGAPEINIGTFSMDRERWAHVLKPFIETLRAFEFQGRTVDVRENIAFEGRGEQTRFVHEAFPETGCAIAVEFKKFFMDEWTGLPDLEALVAMRAMLRSTLPVLESSLRSHE